VGSQEMTAWYPVLPVAPSRAKTSTAIWSPTAGLLAVWCTLWLPLAVSRSSQPARAFIAGGKRGPGAASIAVARIDWVGERRCAVAVDDFHHLPDEGAEGLHACRVREGFAVHVGEVVGAARVVPSRCEIRGGPPTFDDRGDRRLWIGEGEGFGDVRRTRSRCFDQSCQVVVVGRWSRHAVRTGIQDRLIEEDVVVTDIDDLLAHHVGAERIRAHDPACVGWPETQEAGVDDHVVRHVGFQDFTKFPKPLPRVHDGVVIEIEVVGQAAVVAQHPTRQVVVCGVADHEGIDRVTAIIESAAVVRVEGLPNARKPWSS
jgi:hypothetical protein